MLKYFDDIVGKGLEWIVLAELFFYFAIFVTPIAIPLAVLLSSLMTFGNLGEHFELTAIKSAGISLVRALAPIFVFVLFLTIVAFYSNNYFVPKAALEAYSLLYDIKQKKPALDLKEGAFYNGIPDFSIKVNEKLEDGQTLKDVIIYDHREKTGNKKITIADSGRMSTFHNERYLKLELFDGHVYNENVEAASTKGPRKESLYRSAFTKSEFIMDLSSFALGDTDKDLFSSNRIMRNISELSVDVDSMKRSILDKKLDVYRQMQTAFYYHMRNDSIEMPAALASHEKHRDSVNRAHIEQRAKVDSLKKIKGKGPVKNTTASEKKVKATTGVLGAKHDKVNDASVKRNEKPAQKRAPEGKTAIARKNLTNDAPVSKKNALPEKIKKVPNKRLPQMTTEELVDSLMAQEAGSRALQSGLNIARQTKSKIQAADNRLKKLKREQNIYEIQWHKILANSAACIIMFLIGAPLGAIIKRGGLGMPVLVSIIFFIIFYVISMMGEKYAKQDLLDPGYAIWAANAVLLPIGLVFLRQARNDARLFEADFYKVLFDKMKTWIGKIRTGKEAK